jgi:iron complex transport system ATP-binding protein
MDLKPETPPVMEAKGLRVEAGGRAILTDVRFAIPAGKVTVLLGPNGAGKSTLLKALAGSLRPHSGEVLLNGKPLADQGAATCARARAVLLQDFHLPFAFTVEEVALMGRHPHVSGRETARDREAAREALRAADMWDFRARLYPTLSGGERQRTHWARILAQLDPESGLQDKCVLLDEPTSSLDLAHQHSLLAGARDLARRGAGVLVVLHDLNLAARYGDLLVLLRQGSLVAQGTPGEVLTPERIRTVYGVDARVFADPESGRPWVFVHGEAPENPETPPAARSSRMTQPVPA